MAHRLVAMTAIWSGDHWLDVTHVTPRSGSDAAGPNEYEHVLIREFDYEPKIVEMEEALARFERTLLDVEGRAELRSYALVDEDAWRSFVAAPHAARPLVHAHPAHAVFGQFEGLESATEAQARSGVRFRPWRSP